MHSYIKYVCHESTTDLGLSLVMPFDGPAVDDHHLVDSRLRLAPFKPLVCHHSAGVHVEIKESHPPNISPITAVTPKACATAVAHPQSRFLIEALIKHAIVIDMVTGYINECP
jgi:hypothetical protein